MTTGTMSRLHDDEGAPDGATSGRARGLALRRRGSGGWRYHDEGALVGADPVYLARDTRDAARARAGATPGGRRLGATSPSTGPLATGPLAGARGGATPGGRRFALRPGGRGGSRCPGVAGRG